MEFGRMSNGKIHPTVQAAIDRGLAARATIPELRAEGHTLGGAEGEDQLKEKEQEAGTDKNPIILN